MDKSWMTIKNRLTSTEYKEGVNSFIKFAMANVGLQDEIRCPCVDCLNGKKLSIKAVKIHLIRRGISPIYTTWVHHGESVPMCQPPISNDENCDDGETGGEKMAGNIPENQDNLYEMLEEIYSAGLETDDINDGSLTKEFPNLDKLLDEAQRKLYSGCEDSVLSFVVMMLHVKVHYRLSNKAFDAVMMVIKRIIPQCDQTIPWTLTETKKFLRDLGLEYVKIHACKNDCVLFWKENADLEKCPTCHESRYKVNNGKGKKIPHKISVSSLDTKVEEVICVKENGYRYEVA